MTKIYTLEHPITGEIRYVGKTIQTLKERLRLHIRDCDKNKAHSAKWIKSLLNQNLKPIITLLDEVPDNEFAFWEQYWISQMKTWNINLTNHLPGGEGFPVGWRMSEETKQKLKNRIVSRETREKLSIISKTRGISQETRDKMNLHRKNKKYSLGYKFTEEQKINSGKSKWKPVRHKVTGEVFGGLKEVVQKTGENYKKLSERLRLSLKCNEYEYI